jgi:glucose-6-phosphate 1-dehydrogenase
MAAVSAAPPCAMVIFGVRGDLAKRLLIPALYNLRAGDLLDEAFRIIGVDHGDNDDAGIRRDLRAFVDELAGGKASPLATGAVDEGVWSWLADRISYHKGAFEDAGAYEALARTLTAEGGDKGAGSVLFYAATAPRFFTDVADGLAGAGLLKAPEGGFRRLVVEKPFGEDLASARELNARLRKCLAEDQIYRIDHFLGKETVRNIMVTRFGNDVFEPLWNRMHIDSVQITAAETVGVEGRGGFYETVGALRDMTPNHLCQLVGMIAMEPPNSFDAEAVRAEKGRAIEAIVQLDVTEARERMAAGQYGAGSVGGRSVAAYRDSPRVSKDSNTETFVALKLTIDNWRWAGVPFYLRTGKALAGHVTEIAIQFKAAPHTLFQSLAQGASTPNVLVLRIYPDEGISMVIDAKKPGPDVELAQVSMDFRYADHFATRPATGYESLIYDALIGDATLFSRGQDVEAGWAAVQPFLDALAAGGVPEAYPAGSQGPAGAAALLDRDGRVWRPL